MNSRLPASTFDSQFSSRSRFVILIHDHPFVHWDLLLESGDAARTWRLLESPAQWLLAALPQTLPAELMAPHRLAYLDYEGPVSRERGSVRRWDHGSFEWLQQSDSAAHVLLSGDKLQGELSLRQKHGMLWSADFRTV